MGPDLKSSLIALISSDIYTHQSKMMLRRRRNTRPEDFKTLREVS